MNKLATTIVAIGGGCNQVMSLLIPIAVSLLIITNYPDLSSASAATLLAVGLISSIFRGVKLILE